MQQAQAERSRAQEAKAKAEAAAAGSQEKEAAATKAEAELRAQLQKLQEDEARLPIAPPCTHPCGSFLAGTGPQTQRFLCWAQDPLLGLSCQSC